MKRPKPRQPKPGRADRSAKASRKSRAKTTAKLDTVDALVTAQARALGLALDPAWLETVAFNLRLILQHAALVDEFKLSDSEEPAPIFHA